MEATRSVPLATAAPQSPSTVDIQSPWGRVDEEYALIRADLKRLLAITTLICALLVVLTIVLR